MVSTSPRFAIVGADLDQCDLVLHGRVAGDVLDLEHVDEPVELFGRLFDRHVVSRSVIVMRLTSGWFSVTDREVSMLKLRARIKLATRLRTPGLFRTMATRT